MEFTMTIVIFILLALSIILVTRNLMIYNIRRIAIYLRWDNNVVGRLLGYATSTPELVNAVVAGSIGMISASVFNLLSANIINIVNVFIVTIVFKRTRSVFKKKFIQDYLFVILSIIAPAYLIISQNAYKIEAIPLLIFIYVIFLISSKYNDYFVEEKEELEMLQQTEKIAKKMFKRKVTKYRKKKIAISIGILALSLVLLYILGVALGGTLDRLSSIFNISGVVLGIIMGFLTSIPELVTYISSYHRHRRCKNPNRDKGAIEVVNDLVTSNISNITIIQTVAIIAFCFIYS